MAQQSHTVSSTCRRANARLRAFSYGYRVPPLRYHLGITKKREVGRKTPTRGGTNSRPADTTSNKFERMVNYFAAVEKAPGDFPVSLVRRNRGELV